MTDLIQKWGQRQAQLEKHLTELGAVNLNLRVDTVGGILEWVDNDGQPKARAKASGLCRYSLRFGTVTMAWAADQKNDDRVVISPVEGMEENYHNCGEGDAWKVALQAADACGAQYLYRFPTAEEFFFFAIELPEAVS